MFLTLIIQDTKLSPSPTRLQEGAVGQFLTMHKFSPTEQSLTGPIMNNAQGRFPCEV